MLAIAITGSGALSAVGGNAAESWTSIHTGISRFTTIGANRVGAERVGAEVADDCDYIGGQRLLHLARVAATEAAQAASLPAAGRVALMLCLPSPLRPDAPDFDASWRQALAEAIGRPLTSVQTFNQGAAGFAAAITAASSLLSNRSCDVVMLGAADSLHRLKTMRWLESFQRLKLDGSAGGLIPGEAAAFVTLEAADAAESRRAPALAILRGAGAGSEAGHYTSNEVCLATGMTDALRIATESASSIGPPAAIVSDLNGEAYKAKEWAYAEVRVLSTSPGLHLHPADCLGDCGAAMGVLLLALAARGLSRGELPSPAIVVAGSDGPDRGVAVLVNGNSQAPTQRRLSATMPVTGPRTQAAAYSLAAEHLDEAGFLWTVRDVKAVAPDWSPQDLARHDGRLSAHLNALAAREAIALHACDDAIDAMDAGLAFAITVTALRLNAEITLANVFDAAKAKPGIRRPVASALAWADSASGQNQMRELVRSTDPALRVIGISAMAVRRSDPGSVLAECIGSGNAVLRVRAMFAAAELGRTDLASLLRGAVADADPTVAFAAAWSAALLTGDPPSIAALQRIAESDSPNAPHAAEMAARRLDVSASRSWQIRLRKDPRGLRTAILVAGVSGDPEAIPWLLDQARMPLWARAAGEAVTRITGVNLDDPGLRGAPAPGVDAGPNDDPADENTAPDPDDGLPWPAESRLRQWWDANGGRFTPGQRYAFGSAPTVESLQSLRASLNQRYRREAAIQASIVQPRLAMEETRRNASR